MSVRSTAGGTQSKDLTREIPRFAVTSFGAGALFLVLAPFGNGHTAILWPLFWAAAAAFVVVVVFRRGSRASRRLGPWVTPVGAFLVVAVLLGTGGIAYTYGFYGDLAAFATADGDPLDLSDGANHTVLAELRNVGSTTVRVWPEVRLGLENASGEAVRSDGLCPPTAYGVSRGPRTDRGATELPPGGTITFEVTVRSDGEHIPSNESCDRWPIVAGESYLLQAVIRGETRSATLPVWTGSVESNRIVVVP